MVKIVPNPQPGLSYTFNYGDLPLPIPLGFTHLGRYPGLLAEALATMLFHGPNGKKQFPVEVWIFRDGHLAWLYIVNVSGIAEIKFAATRRDEGDAA